MQLIPDVPTPSNASTAPKVKPMDADLCTYGFPAGYFIIKNVASDRYLDVDSDMVEDGTRLILYPPTETSLVEGAYGSSRTPKA